MKKTIKILTLILTVVCCAAFVLTAYGIYKLPDDFLTSGSKIDLGPVFSLSRENGAVSAFSGDAEDTGNQSGYNVKLMNIIPVKTVSVSVTSRKYLAAGGELVGVRLKTDGVCVVSTDSFENAENVKVSPAADAGIQKGDSILSIDGSPVTKCEELTKAIENSAGKTLELKIRRGEEEKKVFLTPEKTSATGLYKGGLWVRDSTVGIGTLSYSDLEAGTIAALGHGIYDPDSEKILSVSEGEILSADVASVKKGYAGTPGEITGIIGTNTLGSITENSDRGIFGELNFVDGRPDIYPVATASEAHTGKAQIICTVTEGEKQFYDIEIVRLNKDPGTDKNMTVKITDAALLAITGGIVQGMSGSPVIQDGYFVGAVTHVFVNDPKCGYAIFAENMLRLSEGTN